MNMTDPVADLLTRIRNASMAREEQVTVPASRLKANIVKVLRDEGFVASFRLVRDGTKANIQIQLKYEGGKPVIQGIRRVSRPGLRKYVGHNDVAKIKSGIGLAIVSTSKGVLTGAAARTQKVGGEFLCEVW